MILAMGRGYPKDDEVEALARCEARERLPVARLLLLYLDPFSLFKDTTRGSLFERSRALSYNRAMRWMLLAYARRWIAIGVVFLAGTGLAEAASGGSGLLVIPAAAFGVAFAVSFTVTTCTLAAYLLLGVAGER